MRSSFHAALLWGALSVATMSCDNSKFSGNNNNLRSKLAKGTGDNNAIPKGAANTADFNLLCPSNPEKAKTQKNIALKNGSQAKVAGEICLEQSMSNTGIDFVFVVDTSDSMAFSDKSCRRREAIAAVVNKIATSAAPNADLRFGLVKFNSTSSILQHLSGLDSISAIASNSNLCKSEKQTNYEAAFHDARTVLSKSENRQKIVYFLSDGIPTEDDSSGSASDNGLKSANALFELGNVKIFSIFLESKFGSGRDYLEKISRDPSHVKTVSKADDLVSEILKFDVPQPTAINASDVHLSISIEGGANETIDVASLTQSSTDPKIWHFVSAPFLPPHGSSSSTNATISVNMNAAGSQNFSNSDNFLVLFE
jgi:Mg-chelatase subunit ChlD